MGLRLETKHAVGGLDADALEREIERAGAFMNGLFHDKERDAEFKGWVNPDDAAVQLDAIREKAAEIRERADVFVLVGVGGSNQAARAAVKALPNAGGPEVLYAGNTLSADYTAGILDAIGDRSAYVNVIAKNFATLEPGVHYRMLRQELRRRYGPEEMARRFILTGTRESRLHEIARENGNLFLDFPVAVGGRFSAFTPVGLMPMAAAGLDVDAYLDGVRAMADELRGEGGRMALEYAAVRNLLLAGGVTVEMLACFEPRLEYFAKWWVQLFGESEGKNGTGLFPASGVYSEDLHSIGQYLQEGGRFILETFLSVGEPGRGLPIASDPGFGDGFDDLDGMDFADLNRAAEQGTLEAHVAGGLPCLRLAVDRLDEYHFGQLYYFFMVACSVSGRLLGVNPFTQDGVEQYKQRMFAALKKG